MGVKIVGHRTNTIRRLRFYKKHRVDYLELDLTQNKDNDSDKLIVYHGENLVTAVSRKEWLVRRLLSKLQGRDRMFLKPLSTEEALENILSLMGNSVGLWFDLKNVNNTNNVIELIRLTEKLGFSRPLIISSNNIRQLKKLDYARSEKGLSAVYLAFNMLYEEPDEFLVRELLSDTGADIVSFNTDSFDIKLAKRLKRAGYGISLWTVNSPWYLSRLRHVIEKGVLDYLITDRPDLIRRHFRFLE